MNSYDILPVLSRSYLIDSGQFLRLSDLPEWPLVDSQVRWPGAIEREFWKTISSQHTTLANRADALRCILFSVVMSTAKYREYPLVVDAPMVIRSSDADHESQVRVDVGYDGDGSVLCLLSATSLLKKTAVTPSRL